MTSLVGQLVALVFVRQDQGRWHGIQPKGVVVFP